MVKRISCLQKTGEKRQRRREWESERDTPYNLRRSSEVQKK